MSIRKWAIALSLTVFGFGFANQANAGFTGDTVSVSLTAHTSGAVDQVVFSGDSITEPGSIVGDSTPYGASSPLSWTFTLVGNTFTLNVSDINNIGPTSVDPLLLTITGIDSAVTGVNIIGANTFGFAPGDIDFSTPGTITVSASTLAILAQGGTLETTFSVVPEASTFIMMSLVASGLAGGVIARRRKVQG